MHGIELGMTTGRRLVGVIRARCGDREKKGALSVVRLLEGGGGTAKNEGDIVKGLGKKLRKGRKEKGTNDDIVGQGKNWTEKNQLTGGTRAERGKLWAGKKENDGENEQGWVRD